MKDELEKETIEEAAKKYRKSTINKMAIEETAFIKGAKSDASKNYWLKKICNYGA